MTIQIRAIEQYFSVVLFIMRYKLVLIFGFVDKILRSLYSVAIQMKATEQYFPVVLFITLYNVILTFESVEESYSMTIQMIVTEQYFPVVLFIMLYKVVLTFESVDEILKCDYSNKSYLTVLPCSAACFSVFLFFQYF